MPEHVYRKVVSGLNSHGKPVKGSKVLILGVSYKRDVGDTRESPALDTMTLLQRDGAELSYHDPYVNRLHLGDTEMCSCNLDEETVKNAACVLLMTDHTTFDAPTIAQWASLIVDSRNAFKKVSEGRDKIIKI